MTFRHRFRHARQLWTRSPRCCRSIDEARILEEDDAVSDGEFALTALCHDGMLFVQDPPFDRDRAKGPVEPLNVRVCVGKNE